MTLRRITRLLAAGLAVAVAAGCMASSAGAKPADVPRSTALQTLPTTGTAGPASITLGPGRRSIPIGSSFRYECQVQSKKPLAVVLARLRLLRADGGLVYQKTFVEHSLEETTVAFEWDRRIDDIGLGAGAYPIELGVDVEQGGSTHRASVPASLFVYDPAKAALPVALVARISAQPLSDPQGRFVSDPARFTRARDDARRLAEWVLNNPEARVSVSLSPVMVREWSRIAAGYQLIGAEGTVDVAPTEPVCIAYASTLESLRLAIQTGRLEVLSAGFGDPDLFELKDAQLLDDIETQYAFGKTTLLESLSTTPSAGSAPVRGVPTEALTRLARAGVGYVVVPAAQTKRGTRQPSAGLYRAADSPLAALVADGELSRAVAASSTITAIDIAFSRHLASATAPRPVPVLVNLGPESANVDRVITTASEFAKTPWLKLVTGAEAARGTLKTRVTLRERKPDADAPSRYWERVAESRRLADALAALLPGDDESGPRAIRQSLTAAASAWAGPKGDWAPATSGLAFAVNAIDAANDVFGHLKLSASKITLAGSAGTLPVTISNGTESVLRAVLVATPGNGVKLRGPDRIEIELDPGDNFIEIPVALDNAFAGGVGLKLLAGETQIADSEVRVQGSYLDRLVVGGAALILILGLLFFVIRRVQAAEKAETDDVVAGQLTLDIVEAVSLDSPSADSPQEQHAPGD